MAKSILVTGGARSGKSLLAEQLTLQFGQPAIYVATAQAGDAEMAARITDHRSRRGDGWTTVETPLALVQTLRDTDDGSPRLVDCLTLWLSNLMLAGADWGGEAADLAASLPALQGPVVLVTNEVGAGIVPANALARDFRDAAGVVNQRIAAACDQVWLSVAGCPMRIKPQ